MNGYYNHNTDTNTMNLLENLPYCSAYCKVIANEELDEVFYIDIFDGIVKEGSFMKYDKDGLWIQIQEDSANIFVYSDLNDEKVCKQRDNAETSLVKIRSGMKDRLFQNNTFVNDICKRLEQHEGKLYTEIIKEILQEKIAG